MSLRADRHPDQNPHQIRTHSQEQHLFFFYISFYFVKLVKTRISSDRFTVKGIRGETKLTTALNRSG